MATHTELVQALEDLNRQILQARELEIGDALQKIQALVHDFGLTSDDIFGTKVKKSSAQIAPKYRDPVSGATWSGRGKPPKWIAGGNRAEFAIA